MRFISNTDEYFKLRATCSNNTGPIVIISGLVHGNEHCGVCALDALWNEVQQHKLKKGTLLLCAANIAAAQQNKRFIDFDLNRCFGDSLPYGHELLVANVLRKKLSNLDYSSNIYLLDLHSTSAPTTPFCAGKFSERHIQAFHKTGIDVYTYGWGKHRGFSMLIDEIDRLGGTGIIVECGEHGEPETNKIAIHAAFTFLKSFGMIDFDRLPTLRSGEKIVVEIRRIIKAETNDFKFLRAYKNFDLINAGEIVANDGGNPIFFNTDFLIVMPTSTKLKAGQESFGIGILETKLVI